MEASVQNAVKFDLIETTSLKNSGYFTTYFINNLSSCKCELFPAHISVNRSYDSWEHLIATGPLKSDDFDCNVRARDPNKNNSSEYAISNLLLAYKYLWKHCKLLANLF